MTQKEPFLQKSRLTEVVERVRWGVVYIERGKKCGTGFIANRDGYIVTALHILNETGKTSVKLWNHDNVEAEVIRTSDALDLAVLKIDMPHCDHDHVLDLQEAGRQLFTGADIAYTGYSFGPRLYGFPVLSTHRGIISSRIPRKINDVEVIFYHIDGLMNEGLSGSPIYGPESGVVAGIINKYYGTQLGLMGTGIGGAVPIEYTHQILKIE